MLAVQVINWSQLELFTGLDAVQLTPVIASARRHVYPAGSFLFREGEASAGYFALSDGMVRLYRANPEGRLHTLSLLRAPAAFNEVAAVDGGPNPLNALAVTDCVAFTLSHGSLRALMSSESVVMGNALKILAHINRDTLERLEDMTFRTIPGRLAKLFLHQSAYGQHICEAPSHLSQEDMASILGTTREVVGRALRSLMTAGLLRKQGRYYAAADLDGLLTLAETNELPQKLTCVKK
ncbi:MAG: Crp/Fnr family transcriptional regulator [Pleurocapsa minor GSE-CHR-MK-17-07R]|nr:Crp/Fnr family transcriptional regulator [Pleurocapsa minor GSE-CHR-MK 17-07R]